MAKPPHHQITSVTRDGSGWPAALKMPFFHIDPLKIDLNAVTKVMSSDYAAKKGILPVEVNGSEVTIAVSEPFITSWGSGPGARLLRLKVKRRARQSGGHRALPGRVSSTSPKSMKARGVHGACRTSGFSKLRAAGRDGASPGAPSTPTTTTSSTSSIGCGSTPSTSAPSDIHVEPRRDVGILRFRIDGVLHEVYQVPYPVLLAMTARIKILGRMDVVEKRRPQERTHQDAHADGRRGRVAPVHAFPPRTARSW